MSSSVSEKKNNVSFIQWIEEKTKCPEGQIKIYRPIAGMIVPICVDKDSEKAKAFYEKTTQGHIFPHF